MEEKINALLKKDFFKSVEIDEKGYGTFFKRAGTSQQNNYLCDAKSFKREGDALYKQRKDLEGEDETQLMGQYSDLYIKSILSYIKGYKLQDLKIQKQLSIGNWKGLYKYIKEISTFCKSKKRQDFLQRCLFSVKFHYLQLELSILESQEHFKYVKKEIASLYKQFNSLQSVNALENLEEIYNTQL